MFDITVKYLRDIYTFRLINRMKCEVSRVYIFPEDEIDEHDEHGTFHLVQNQKWILISDNIPLAIINNSEEYDGHIVPSSDEEDWERVLGPNDETVFLDILQKCYDN